MLVGWYFKNMNTKTVYITRSNLFKDISMILFNKITDIDNSFIEDNWHLFSTECKDCEGTGEIMTPMGNERCEECYGQGSFDREFYQYFLTDMDEYNAEYLKEWGVSVGYSNKLEKYIICIGDFGTSWSAFSYSKEVPEDYQLSYNETLKRETVY